MDDNLIDSILDAATGLAGDVTESVIDLVTDVAAEMGDLSHDDVVKLVEAAISGTAGAAVKTAMDRSRLPRAPAG